MLDFLYVEIRTRYLTCLGEKLNVNISCGVFYLSLKSMVTNFILENFGDYGKRIYFGDYGNRILFWRLW